MMLMIIWARYFMEAQGYHITDNIVNQNNEITMLIDRKGKDSSGKRTKHINIRYFFVTDQIKIKKCHLNIAWHITCLVIFSPDLVRVHYFADYAN